MSPQIDEPFRTIYCDPGEDFGWAIARGSKLLGAGTEKMWEFIDNVWDVCTFAYEDGSFSDVVYLGSGQRDWLRTEIDPDENYGRIGRIVAEDWRLYPHKLKDLAWDQCRTARALGALKLICRIHDIEFVLQPAAIKQRAIDGGAEELFYRPLHENRHQNDALMHYWFYTQTELMKSYYSGLDNLPGKAEADA